MDFDSRLFLLVLNLLRGGGVSLFLKFQMVVKKCCHTKTCLTCLEVGFWADDSSSLCLCILV